MDSEAKAERFDLGTRTVVATGIGVLIVWLAITVGLRWTLGSWEAASCVGDASGLANSLFSGLAFAGVICAILLQRGELRLQRLELALTREELARAASAQEKGQRAQTKQVQMLHLTAKLEALNTMISAVTQRLQRSADGSLEKRSLETRLAGYFGQAEELSRAIEAEVKSDAPSSNAAG